jgi:hypothetical protein
LNNSRHIVERRRALSEAFHSFHQPLTSLHCGLEIALLKDRTSGEYRERVQDALVHAGTILRLNKALRELVEASDPGERFGSVNARALLGQVIEDVQVVAEPALVAVVLGSVPDVSLKADPLKITRILGQTIAYRVTDLNPGSSLKINSQVLASRLALKIVSEGKLRESRPENDIETKLRAIALDAADAYIQTIGGERRVVDAKTIEIMLPLAN